MSSKLLDNQFSEMESFDNNETLLNLDVTDSVDDLIKQLQSFISDKT
jgi:gluconate kinase